MTRRIAKLLMLVLALGTVAHAAGNISAKTAPDGSVELSNQVGDEQAAPAAAEPAVEAATAPESSNTAAAEGGAAKVTAPEPLAWYGSIPPAEVKDKDLAQTLSKIGTTQLATGNPAVGRRYLMIDKATYLQQNGGN